MAWALKHPDGFGKYWPSGTCIGWRDQLFSFFNNGMSEKQRAQAVDDQGMFSTWEISKKFFKDKGEVSEQEAPQHFQTEKGHSELHSMISTQSQKVAVDGDLKQLIEQFEPGVHQFFPFTIHMPKGKTFPKQYYFLVIRQFIEGMLPVEGTFRDRSVVVGGVPVQRYSLLRDTKPYINKVHVSKAAIGSAHLWRDTRMDDPNIFISDALQAAIKDAGLTIFRHHKVKVV